MLVYHGSKEKFDTFDMSQIGLNGTSEGKGLYFTDTKSIAEGYGHKGYLYTVEFSGKKPLSETKVTISKSNLRKFLKVLDKETDYLSNWGDVSYSGFENVLNDAVESELGGSDNDVDLIAGICNASGSIEQTLEILYNVLGYDSIISGAEWGGNQKIHIALVNDIIQIKQVTKM